MQGLVALAQDGNGPNPRDYGVMYEALWARIPWEPHISSQQHSSAPFIV